MTKPKKVDTNTEEANKRIIQAQKKKAKELSSMLELLKPCMAADNLIGSLLEQAKTFVRRKKMLERKIKTADKLMAEGEFAPAHKELVQVLKIQTKIFDVQGEVETNGKITRCEEETKKKDRKSNKRRKGKR